MSNPVFRALFDDFVKLSVIFSAMGLFSKASGAPLVALGAPKIDFGGIWEVIWEAFGDLG